MALMLNTTLAEQDKIQAEGLNGDLNGELKCAFCADPAIRDGLTLSHIPNAVTFAAHMQTFSIPSPQGMQEVMAPVSLPVCYDCRHKQLAPLSKTGLVTA